MGPQAQTLRLQASPLPAQAAWALASSQPDLSTLLLSVGETLSEAMYMPKRWQVRLHAYMWSLDHALFFTGSLIKHGDIWKHPLIKIKRE